MATITAAAIGALGTVISAWIAYQVSRVKTVVNGRTENLERINRELRTENDDLRAELHRRRRTDKRGR